MKIPQIIYKSILSGFGSGFLPKAPGTWGSVVGSLIFFIFLEKFTYAPEVFLSIVIISSFLISIIGIQMIPLLDKKEVKTGYDQKWITLDEIAGVWIASIPVYFFEYSFFGILIAFSLFRVFDILKPFGIKKIDKLHTPFSVFADDIVAGIYSTICFIPLFWIL